MNTKDEREMARNKTKMNEMGKMLDGGHIDKVTYEYTFNRTRVKVWSRSEMCHIDTDEDMVRVVSLTIRYEGYKSEKGRGREDLLDFLDRSFIYDMGAVKKGLLVNSDGEVFLMDRKHEGELRRSGGTTLTKIGEIDDFIDTDNEEHARFRKWFDTMEDEE